MSEEPSQAAPQPDSESRKRKRTGEATEELEIDIHTPEPLSKRELRKAKKAKDAAFLSAIEGQNARDAERRREKHAAGQRRMADHTNGDNNNDKSATAEQQAARPRSEHGVWIGNLPFACDRPTLETFFTSHAAHAIRSRDITRINMPRPAPAGDTAAQGASKAQNKGFAYVDFASKENLEAALELSETLLAGRRVLIKDARNFEGRPVGKDEASAAPKAAPAKPPNERVFVGNLGFEVTKEELKEHFEQCGEVADVFMASFEDTGKCKGFGWVTFKEIEGAKAAVRGWIYKLEDASDEEEGGDAEAQAKKKKTKKPRKQRKWFVNKLHGRILRSEFAEDASTRYNKRFGRGSKQLRASPDYGPEGHADGTNGVQQNAAEGPAVEAITANSTVNGDGIDSKGMTAAQKTDSKKHSEDKPSKPIRDDQPRKTGKPDRRPSKAGAALTKAPRSTGAIVKSMGKKILFD